MAWARLRALAWAPAQKDSLLLFALILSLAVGLALTVLVSWHVHLILTRQVCLHPGFIGD